MLSKNKINSFIFNSIPTSYLAYIVHSQHNRHYIFPPIFAKGDSGATNHYLRPDHLQFLTRVCTGTNGPSVQLPNNDVITATATGLLDLHADLSASAQKAHVLPRLGTSLLSLGQLTDDGCLILLDKAQLKVFKNFKLLLTGTRNLSDGFWDIPLLLSTPQHIKHLCRFFTSPMLSFHGTSHLRHSSNTYMLLCTVLPNVLSCKQSVMGILSRGRAAGRSSSG